MCNYHLWDGKTRSICICPCHNAPHKLSSTSSNLLNSRDNDNHDLLKPKYCVEYVSMCVMVLWFVAVSTVTATNCSDIVIIYNFTSHLIFCSINFTALQIKTANLNSISTQNRGRKDFWFCWIYTFWHTIVITCYLSSSLCWLLAHWDLVWSDRVPGSPSLAFHTRDLARH